MQRIINVPKRGIGGVSIGKITLWAAMQNVSFYTACTRAGEIEGLGKAAGKVLAFTGQIAAFRSHLERGSSIKELIEEILEDTGYRKELEDEDDIEAETRLENIQELMNKAVSYTDGSENPN